ncbi:TOM1-like protein 6 [Linum grandiflorum]
MAMASSSSSSATVAVDKATSDLLISPDWTINIHICDSINTNHWQAKDVVKAVKKRLQHRNPGVQLLALTLLETMVKNCDDFVHFQIVEKNILGEMVKIVKKKTDLHVRDKILDLLDSWQEAFGGAGGKYPQYYWACEDLRRSGIQFPPRSLDAAPVFTAPLTHSTLGNALPGFGIPGGSSTTLDETMATEMEGLSLSSLESMRNVMDLLRDMLQAVGPDDHEAVKDEVIVDLVERCRSNQKKLMQMLTTTGEEEVLVQGLELNDSLQILLAKHDAIASGSPMPSLARSEQRDGSSSNTKPEEVKDQIPGPTTEPNTLVTNVTNGHADEYDEEEEDDFAQLARRHTKSRPISTEAINGAASGVLIPVESSPALEMGNPHTSAMNRQEQDMIDLLSITLSTNYTSPPSGTCQTTLPSEKNMPQIPVSSGTGSQDPTTYGSYVAAWAQSEHQQHSQSMQIPSASQSQPHLHQQHPQYLQQPPQSQPQQQKQQEEHPQYSQQPSQSQLHLHQQQPQFQQQGRPPQQSEYPHYSSGYPPPPWAGTSQTYIADNNTFARPHDGSFAPGMNYGTSPSIGSDGTNRNGDPFMGSGVRASAEAAVQKPFVPSYKLFEDLNVIGKSKPTATNRGPSLSTSSGQSMMNSRK